MRCTAAAFLPAIKREYRPTTKVWLKILRQYCAESGARHPRGGMGQVLYLFSQSCRPAARGAPGPGRWTRHTITHSPSWAALQLQVWLYRISFANIPAFTYLNNTFRIDFKQTDAVFATSILKSFSRQLLLCSTEMDD